MPDVLGLTPGKNVPSSRFRISQFHSELAKFNYSLTECHSPVPYDYKLPGLLGRVRQRYVLPLSGSVLLAKIASRIPQIARSYNYHVTWLNRPLTDGVFLEKFLHRPLIFDVDDAIWLNDFKHTRKIAGLSDVIFAGNSFIANWFSQFNKNIVIIPTAIDTERFKPGSRKNDGFFNVVWTGSRQTEKYLLSIERALFQFISHKKDARLIIVSDAMPAFRFLGPENVVFNKWNPETETSALQQADVGIMPLFDSDWEKGKCSFKMLQYMATGLPVIVSPVGMNKEVFSEGEIGFLAENEHGWIESLGFLFSNKRRAEIMGDTGREIILKKFSIPVVAGDIIKAFKTLSR